MYQFRDPIHGFIDVSDLELKIIDSTPFQRLRNIKQLATTYLVYHGAEHTRFGHSLGVMQLVTKSFNSALENYKKVRGEELFDDIKRAWYTQILRIIALIHDLGHAPFSHASEALFDKGIEHEDFTKKIIYETEIAYYIEEIGKEFVREKEVDEGYHITSDLIWLIYGEKNAELNPKYIMPDFKFLKSFMDSDLDCDKMDYLLRDSYYCGVNYGKYDLNKLISSLTVYKKACDNIIQLAIESGGIHAFEEFVIARYFMFIQVYFHKTRRYLDKLLVDCISSILPDSKYPSGVKEYLKFDDHYMIAKIQEKSNTNNEAKLFISREIMSCIYETSSHSNHDADFYIVNAIKNSLKKIKGCAVFEDTPSKLAHKIPMLEPYNYDSGKSIPIIVKYADEPTSIAEKSLLLKSLRDPISIKRIYVEKHFASEAKALVHDLLNNREEYG